MKWKQYLLPLLLVILITGLLFQKQLSTHLKIILFISEQFPQIPVKPLGLLTPNPEHNRVEFETSNGKVVADLFIPRSNNTKSALIVAMGIKTAEDDKPLILHFADSLARLGYVVFWPRLQALDQGQALPEEPETFIKAFEYLEKEASVNSDRISYMGFSVGSSTAYVAASDPEISDQVHGLVFFGGHFDVFEYLSNLASKTYQANGQRVEWNVSDDARNHAKALLEAKQANQMVKIFDATSSAEVEKVLDLVPKQEVNALEKYSPKEKLNQFKASIFILHDKSDTYVPYVESVKLYQALPKEQLGAYHISDLFEHVQPNRSIKLEELVKLYGFLYKVLNFL